MRKIATKEDEIANDIISMIVSSGMTFKQANDALQIVNLIMQESSMNFRDNADVKEVLETPNRYRTGLEARLNEDIYPCKNDEVKEKICMAKSKEVDEEVAV